MGINHYQQIIKQFGTERIKRDELMSIHTTIKIGGLADLFFEARTKEEIRQAVEICQKKKINFFLLGSGSNLLVSDNGFRGLVIKNQIDYIKIVGAKGRINFQTHGIENILVEAGSGTLLNKLVRFVIDEGLEGMEYFLGLPGTVGGAIWNNAHNLKEKKFIGDLVYQAEVLIPDKGFQIVNKDYFHFNYDQSALKNTQTFLLSVIFNLKRGDKNKIWDKAMEEINFRKNTQPVLPSFGCTFQNISQADALRLATLGYTTSVGYLIDKAGLKNTKIGQAQISEKHANFIVNLGGAKAVDVIQLIKLCQEKVKAKFGIDLKEEVVYLGEF